jgi:hypothetical protein
MLVHSVAAGTYRPSCWAEIVQLDSPFRKIVEAESRESGRAREVVSLSESATVAEKDLIAEKTNRIARTTQSLDPSFPVSS